MNVGGLFCLLIIKTEKAEVLISQVNSMMNTHKVTDKGIITLQKGINIIIIKEVNQEPVTVKVGI